MRLLRKPVRQFHDLAIRGATGLLDLVVPPRCASCGAWLAHPLCAVCRERLEPDGEDAAIPHLEACVAAVAYTGDAVDWLHRFKYPPPGLAGLDGVPTSVVRDLVADAAHLAPEPLPDRVVPVPLHRLRLRARGFNPAAVLARQVARETGAILLPLALVRTRDTPTQTGLDRRARRLNVAGAFQAASHTPGTVWLVDDVVTTGATLSECARVLRRRGAHRVVAICVARTSRRLDYAPRR